MLVKVHHFKRISHVIGNGCAVSTAVACDCEGMKMKDIIIVVCVVEPTDLTKSYML